MLALIGMICFILKLFKVELGDIDLVVLGLAFVAAHLAFGPLVAIPTYQRRVD